MPPSTSPRIGIALGGGGVRGLAHIPILETLDTMGVEVTCISGTSIGALIGALYAAGHKAKDINAITEDLLGLGHKTGRFLDKLKWLDQLALDIGRGRIFSAERFLEGYCEALQVNTFEELDIPLRVVAADFWQREQVIFESGDLLSPIKASFALPGVFKPVEINGALFIDGGCVNPVPFDVIRDTCDILIAVDVLGTRTPTEDFMPSITDALFNSFQIAEKSIVREKMKRIKPDIFIEPAMENIRVMDFRKVDMIFDETESWRTQLRDELNARLNEVNYL